MHAEQKNVSLDIITSRKTPDIAVVATIGFKCGDQSLKCLKTNHPASLIKGAESAALAFAVFECVRDKLVGSPQAMASSKVSSVCCSASHGSFTICWNTKGTISAVRSTVAKVASCFAPWKQFSRYSDNIKFLGGKPDRGVFNRQASDFAAAIQKSVNFCVVGKLGKHTPAHLKKVISSAIAKIPKQVAAKPLTLPPAHPEAKCEYPTVAASGLNAILTAEYVRSNSNGMSVDVCPGKIVVFSKSWESKRRQLADKKRISKHIEQKYSKLKDDLHGVLAYLVATKCDGTGAAIKQASKVSPADITKRILSVLK